MVREQCQLIWVILLDSGLGDKLVHWDYWREYDPYCIRMEKLGLVFNTEEEAEEMAQKILKFIRMEKEKRENRRVE